MISHQFKYHFKSFIHRNRLLYKLVIATFTINFILLTVAFINYADDSSMGSFYSFYHSLAEQFLAPASMELFLDSPWKVITSFFAYTSIFNLIIDSFFLLIIGNLFIEYFSFKKLVWALFYGHIGAFFFFILPTSIFPQLDANVLITNQLGLSGAAYGVFFAIIALRPKIQVPLFKYQISIQTIGLVLLALNIVSLNNLTFLTTTSHLGASLFGYIYGLLVSKNILPLWGSKGNRFDLGKQKRRPISDDEFNAKRADDEMRINRILDKISKTGYDHLSEAEKEFLFKYKRK